MGVAVFVDPAGTVPSGVAVLVGVGVIVAVKPAVGVLPITVGVIVAVNVTVGENVGVAVLAWPTCCKQASASKSKKTLLLKVLIVPSPLLVVI